jgi:hypothetical protein
MSDGRARVCDCRQHFSMHGQIQRSGPRTLNPRATGCKAPATFHLTRLLPRGREWRESCCDDSVGGTLASYRSRLGAGAIDRRLEPVGGPR